MPVPICSEKGLWIRTYSTRNQVPDCPVFTRAKNKFPSWGFNNFAVTYWSIFNADSILGYSTLTPVLFFWFNFFGWEGRKRIIWKKIVTDRRRWHSFYIFPLFWGSTTVQWVGKFSLNTIEMIESPSEGVKNVFVLCLYSVFRSLTTYSVYKALTTC